MTNDFVAALEEAAQLLAQFATCASSNSRKWNGVAYAAVSEQRFDPNAAIWSSKLSAIAELLSGQEAPISDRQAKYLSRTLFGGMSSLNDLQIDEAHVGPQAAAVNEELDRLRSVLFDQFRCAFPGSDVLPGRS